MESLSREELIDIIGESYSLLDVSTLRVLCFVELVQQRSIDTSKLDLKDPQFWLNLSDAGIITGFELTYAFDKNDIANILLIDYISRKNMKWNIYTSRHIYILNSQLKEKQSLFSPDVKYVYDIIHRSNRITDVIQEETRLNKCQTLVSMPRYDTGPGSLLLTPLLRKFSCIIAPGGYICRSFTTTYLVGSDIDIFFVDCDKI